MTRYEDLVPEGVKMYEEMLANQEKMEAESDPVSRPKHYTSNKYEVIDVIKDQSSPEEYEGFLINNVRKYTARYKHKNGLEDLRKSRWYMDRLISEYESGYLKNDK